MSRPALRRLLMGISAAACVASSAAADQASSQLRTDFGTVGLVEMPSARMAPDGEVSMGGSFSNNTQRYDLGFQALPWLETNFRYAGLQHFDPAFPVYYDRSFALKARLWDESGLIPAVAIGSNDIIGTGVYSGEYLVASKQIGPVDATLGMGWGRLGSANTIRNPLTLISSTFDKRVNETTGVGQFTTGDYFRGPAGIFGGAVWHTPIESLTLIAEVSSDNYTLEQSRGTFRPRNQFNFGASYNALDSMTVGVDWLYGSNVGVNLNFHLDPTTDPYPARLGPPPPPPHVRTDQEQKQALARLTQARNGTARPGPDIGSQSALVDRLWIEVPGVNNVTLKGRALFVSLIGNDFTHACDDATHLVAAYGIGIDTISVMHGEGRPQRCTAPPERGVLAPAVFTQTGATGLANLAVLPEPLVIDAATPPPPDRAQVQTAIRGDVRKQAILLRALSLDDGEAVVYYSNNKYFHEKDAADRLTRVMMADAPSDVERFRLISVNGDQPQREFDILRGPTERVIEQTGEYSLLDDGNNTAPAPLQNPVFTAAIQRDYPIFSWSVFPQFRQQLFDPSNPFAVQLLAAGDATVQLFRGFSIYGEVEGNIYDNFNVDRPSDSLLPHVRTDYAKYFTKGKNGIGTLETAYQFRLAPDLFVLAKAGYLESMFAGGGGELLWRPEGQRWAFGADLYDVWQRNFDRLFGLQSYHVITGHIAVYYASPWYDLNFVARAGQYLAGDRGVTLEVTRRFDTGIEIGVFATKTNVSAATFGEGSFDKGITIRIPISYTVPIETQNVFALDLRPTQRDGGQRLYDDSVLYDQTRRTSYAEIYQSVDPQ